MTGPDSTPSASGRRVFVGIALGCAILTSPLLENVTLDRANDPVPVAAAARPVVRPAAPLAVAPEPSSLPVVTVSSRADGVVAAAADLAAAADAGSFARTATAPYDPRWRSKLSPGYTATDVGCASDLSAASLQAFLAQPLGAIKGFDEPRTFPLGDGRILWTLQDAFIDITGSATSFAHMGYLNNMMLVQDGTCFTSLNRGSVVDPLSFENGTGDVDFDHYFWPAGGAVSGTTFQMFWMEMRRDPANPNPFDGIALHPTATWLATYDLATMQRLSFVPAPDAGVMPVYGYSVVEHDGWAYMFGNSYLRNLALEGGWANGPHSATKMYLARVPQGHLDDAPAYWNGSGWSNDPGAAAPISSRYWSENLIQPVVVGDRWVSATKVDGFMGNSVSIDVADHPWGPWTTVQTLASIPRGDPTDVITYYASITPFVDPSGALIVTLSQIPALLGPDDAPPKYRPNVFAVVL